MDVSDFEKKSGHCGKRGCQCQQAVVLAFILGTLSAVAGMMASRTAQRCIAQMKIKADPIRPTEIQS
jgi:hypothetical protein